MPDQPQGDQPEPEIGGFDLCAVNHDCYEEMTETVTATVDSGAAVCVMPVDTASAYRVKPSQASRDGVMYKAASGHKIPDLGTRTWFAETESGPTSMTCAVAEVDKVLLSVAKIVDKGNVVQFGPTPEQCFVQNIKTGKKMSVARRRDVFVMDMEVIPPDRAPGKTKTLAAVEAWEKRNDQRSGGQRQARRL